MEISVMQKGERVKKNRDAVCRTDGLDAWVDNMKSEEIRNYIRHRIVPRMEWYGSKSRYCENRYRTLMTVSIIVSAIIPVVSIFADGTVYIKVIIALLGAVVTTISALISLQNYNELAVQYRNMREILLNTVYMYFNNRGEFALEQDQQARDGKLVDICEGYIMQEIASWKKLKKIES